MTSRREAPAKDRPLVQGRGQKAGTRTVWLLEAAPGFFGSGEGARRPPGRARADPPRALVLLRLVGGNSGLGAPDERVGRQAPAQAVALGRRLAETAASPGLVPVQRAAHDGVDPSPSREVGAFVPRPQQSHGRILSHSAAVFPSAGLAATVRPGGRVSRPSRAHPARPTSEGAGARPPYRGVGQDLDDGLEAFCRGSHVSEAHLAPGGQRLQSVELLAGRPSR
jgi:hypothetical protein